MNLTTFYRRYGSAGVARLAERAGVAVSGVRQMIYSPRKRPSIARAVALIEACREVLPDGAECLTLEGLANPVPHVAGDFEVPYWPMRETVVHPGRIGRPALCVDGVDSVRSQAPGEANACGV